MKIKILFYSYHSFLYVYSKKIDENGWSLWNDCPNKIKKAIEEISAKYEKGN